MNGRSEDWALYPLLMNSGDPQIAATAKAFSDEMGGLAEAFGVYAQRWDAMSSNRTGPASAMKRTRSSPR